MTDRQQQGKLRLLRPRIDSGHAIVQAIYAARYDPVNLKSVIDRILTSDIALDSFDQASLGLVSLIATAEPELDPALSTEEQAWLEAEGLEHFSALESEVTYVRGASISIELIENEDVFSERVKELGEAMRIRMAMLQYLTRVQLEKNPNLRALFATTWWPIFIDKITELDLVYKSRNPVRLLSRFLGALFIGPPEYDTFGIGPIPKASSKHLKAFCLKCIEVRPAQYSDAYAIFCRRLLEQSKSEDSYICWDCLPKYAFANPEKSILACLALKYAAVSYRELPNLSEFEKGSDPACSTHISDELRAMPNAVGKLIDELNALYQQGSATAERSTLRFDRYLEKPDRILLPDIPAFFTSIGEYVKENDYEGFDVSDELIEEGELGKIEHFLYEFIWPMAVASKVQHLAYAYSVFAFKWPALGPFFTYSISGAHDFAPRSQDERATPAAHGLMLDLRAIFAGDDFPIELGGLLPSPEKIITACETLADVGFSEVASALAACWVEARAVKSDALAFPMDRIGNLFNKIGEEAGKTLLISLRRAVDRHASPQTDAIYALFPQVSRIGLIETRPELVLKALLGDIAWQKLNSEEKDRLISVETTWQDNAGKVDRSSLIAIQGCLMNWFSALEGYLQDLILEIRKNVDEDLDLELEAYGKKLIVFKKIVAKRASFNEIVGFILEIKSKAKTAGFRKLSGELHEFKFVQEHFVGEKERQLTRYLGQLRNKVAHEALEEYDAKMARMSIFDSGFMRTVIESV